MLPDGVLVVPEVVILDSRVGCNKELVVRVRECSVHEPLRQHGVQGRGCTGQAVLHHAQRAGGTVLQVLRMQYKHE